jgi:hypothetical protein
LGTKARLSELFGPHAAAMTAEPHHYTLRYRSPGHWLDVFRTYFGPIHKAVATLDPAGQPALAADLLALVRRFNRADAGSLVASSEYLEVVITKQ